MITQPKKNGRRAASRAMDGMLDPWPTGTIAAAPAEAIYVDGNDQSFRVGGA